ncbi:MAG: ribosome small subunit-dependent GTPase A [Candidatus Cloacimonetes bacterium]|jgi:ribosome biogenesis GTPase|nr:ribosome small subunit-dependent GTPase A [Candidatus Cloacimonadota bacterium]
MSKRKDKFMTIGNEMKLKNIAIEDLDDIYYFESSKGLKTKSSKKLLEKGELSQKSNIKLVKGRVIEVHSNNAYKVKLHNDFKICTLSGRLKYLAHETRTPLCTGDYVNIDVTDEDNLRIEEILERKNTLSRFINYSERQEEVLIASNLDQVVITMSCKEPDFSANLIDRYLCAAEIFEIPAIICINKIDLADNLDEIKKICDYYDYTGYKLIYCSTKTLEGISELKHLLKNKDSVFSGKSGAGKSSIINSLEPGLNLKIGEISEFNNKGTHTTTYSRMIPWSFGGYLIDTPGIKTFGLKNDDIDKIRYCFPGFSILTEFCYFQDCTHTHEENCAIKTNINKTIPEERYNSYLKIRESL